MSEQLDTAIDIFHHKFFILNQNHYQSFSFDPEEELLIAGNDPGCHIHIDNPSVADKHLAIVRVGDQHIFMDRSTRNHVLLNGFQKYQEISDRLSKTLVKIGDLWGLFVDSNIFMENAPKEEKFEKDFIVVSYNGDILESSNKPILVGTDPFCDIILNNEAANFHCLIYFNQDGLFVDDLGNRLQINNQEVNSIFQITETSTLNINGEEIEIHINGSIENSITNYCDSFTEKPTLCLTPLMEEAQAIILKSSGMPLMIGRSKEADINLSDQSVSRLHAKIMVRAKSLSIKDHNSYNHTFVNNEEVLKANVFPGDIIKIGHYSLLLHYSVL